MDMENSLGIKTKEELIKLIKYSAKEFNKFRSENNLEELDLSGSKFQGATLVDINLRNTNLAECDFEYANLIAAVLTNCDLTKAIFKYTNLSSVKFNNSNLTQADLSGAQLQKANLDNVNLSSAILSKVNLTGASLNATNLDGANICSANFSGVDLSNTVNLENAIYDKFTRWPSEKKLPPNFKPEGSITYFDVDELNIDIEKAAIDMPKDNYFDSPDYLQSKQEKQNNFSTYSSDIFVDQADINSKELNNKIDSLLHTVLKVSEKLEKLSVHETSKADQQVELTNKLNKIGRQVESLTKTVQEINVNSTIDNNLSEKIKEELKEITSQQTVKADTESLNQYFNHIQHQLMNQIERKFENQKLITSELEKNFDKSILIKEERLQEIINNLKESLLVTFKQSEINVIEDKKDPKNVISGAINNYEIKKVQKELADLKDTISQMFSKIEDPASQQVDNSNIDGLIEKLNSYNAPNQVNLDATSIINSIEHVIESKFNEFSAKLDDKLNSSEEFKEILFGLDQIENKFNSIQTNENLFDKLKEELKQHVPQSISNNEEITKLESKQDKYYEELLDITTAIEAKIIDIVEKEPSQEYLSIIKDYVEPKLSEISGHYNDLKSVLYNLLEETGNKQIASFEAKINIVSNNIKSISNKVNVFMDEIAVFKGYEGLINSIKLNSDNILESINAKEIAPLQEQINIVTSDIQSLNEKIERLMGEISVIQAYSEVHDDIKSKLKQITDSSFFNNALSDTLNSINEYTENVENKLKKLGNNIENLIMEEKNSKDDIKISIQQLKEDIEPKVEALTNNEMFKTGQEKIDQLLNSINDLKNITQQSIAMSEDNHINKQDFEDLFLNIDAISQSLYNKADVVFEEISNKNSIENLSIKISGVIKLLHNIINKNAESERFLYKLSQLDDLKLINDHVKNIEKRVLERLEEMSVHMLTQTNNIKKKIDDITLVDIVKEIDKMISKSSIDMAKDFNSLSQVTLNMDKYIGNIDKNIKLMHKNTSMIDQKFDDLEEELRNLSSEVFNYEKDKSIESLIRFMEKDADQKLAIMQQLAIKNGPLSTNDDKIKLIEEKLDSQVKGQEEKINIMIDSVNKLLKGIKGIKNIRAEAD